MANNITRRLFVTEGLALTCTLALPGRIFATGYSPAEDGVRLYVVNTVAQTNNGNVRIYDATTADLVQTVPTAYHPDLAVSPDGSRFFVCDSDADGASPGNQLGFSRLRIYDSRTFELLQNAVVWDHPSYGVAPGSNTMLVSDDGRHVYVTQRTNRTRLAVFDLDSGAFVRSSLTMPLGLSFLGTIPRTQNLVACIQSRAVEDVFIVDPLNGNSGSYQAKAGFEFPRSFEHMMSGTAVSPDGDFIYVVARNGRLRVLNASNASLHASVQLEIPPASFVPMEHLLVIGDSLIVGVGDARNATRGIADEAYIYDRRSLQQTETVKLAPSSEELVMSTDNSRLYVASLFSEQPITVYGNGRALFRFDHVDQSLTHFAVAPSPQ